MSNFMNSDFLLRTETAKRLYHKIADDLPIIDYHCHLSPKEIAEDRRFSSITELWLGGDHYKWRLMRSFGVDERYITGDAADREKFRAWARTLSLAIGNPLYHWSHLELRNYFCYDGILNADTADTVFDLCSEKLRDPSFSARNLILRSNVEALCTTDDPADTLEWHKRIAESGFPVKVLPSFRPDRALCIEKPDWVSYLNTLGTAADTEIRSFSDLCSALEVRAEFFDSLGCRVSDHGLAAVPYAPATDEAIMIAGFINATAAPAAMMPATPPIAKVCISVPKYRTVMTITNAKQMAPTQNFSIEKPSKARSNPPAIGNNV